jgi:hypothetical protein
MKSIWVLSGLCILTAIGVLSGASLSGRPPGGSSAQKTPMLLPDLIVDDIYLNQQCCVVVRVKNIGPGRLPDSVWTDHSPESPGVYLSLGRRGWGGESIWKFDPRKSLQTTGQAVYTSTLKISGTAEVSAVVDLHNKLSEANETNNSKKKSLTCRSRGPLPDLQVVNFFIDDREYALAVCIKNNGPGVVPPGGVLSVSVEGVVTDTINLDSILIPDFPGQDFHKAGGATVVGTGWHCPTSTSFRNYNVCATVDATHLITETNEGNNTFCRSEQCRPHSSPSL